MVKWKYSYTPQAIAVHVNRQLVNLLTCQLLPLTLFPHPFFFTFSFLISNFSFPIPSFQPPCLFASQVQEQDDVCLARCKRQQNQ